MALSENLAEDGAGSSGCVGLVGINVHCQSELIVYTADNVLKDDGAGGMYLYGYDLIIHNAQCLGFLGLEVDVTLGNHDALADLDLAAGAFQRAAGVPATSDRKSVV